ncbi:NAD(P)-dependent oxidoreductase [Variovorax guangxiensis]|uniref:NAD(P)-dependent oxidoreductase n=1 Tax=Variovorax guangxiensis TaxID=1775474 RepID=A0A502DCW2_9BURK|nr:NAD(P)-dependent oxidoreductase [Variovorax guangxiensis]TPG23507.1 NAD(P)-dependent oxidoreductase [Variovorax guangxiensis]TPG24034.1 NAD(P)-dependent oxidoreductase [Variovorax ginsengisoli]
MTQSEGRVPAVRQTVACIGLGAMGSAMAGRLLGAGHCVHGFDPDAEAMQRLVALGGLAATNPADAVRAADVLLLAVHDAAQVEQVLFGTEGAASVLRPGGVVWLASTVTADAARSFAIRLQAMDLPMVDGPVSGGVTGARAGELTVIAGGTAAALAAAGAAMGACASAIHHVGPVGAGSTVKMINNLLAASHVALTAEALAFGVRAGVAPDKLIDVVRQSSGNSRMFDKRAPRMAAGEHASQATVKTFMKDLGIALDTARDLSFPTPMAATAQQVFAMAAGLGHAAESDTLLVRVYERLAGIDVEAAAAAEEGKQA